MLKHATRAILLSALAVALACSSSEPAPTPTAAAAAPTSVPSGSTTVTIGSKSTVTVADHPQLGTILVDGEGRTLYLFTRDEGNTSSCTGGCAESWPPLLASFVHLELAGEGVQADLLGTFDRSDGSSQVTYNGHPLYNFSSDQEAGQARGQSIGGVWFVVSPTGEAITTSN